MQKSVTFSANSYLNLKEQKNHEQKDKAELVLSYPQSIVALLVEKQYFVPPRQKRCTEWLCGWAVVLAVLCVCTVGMIAFPFSPRDCRKKGFGGTAGMAYVGTVCSKSHAGGINVVRYL